MKKAMNFLCIACTFSIAVTACGSKEVDQGMTGDFGPADGLVGASAAADGSNTESGEGPFGIYDPAIEFTYAYKTQPIIDFPDGDSLDNNVWTREIEKYGINMEVIWAADEATGDYETKLTMAMASGDLPDIFMSTSYNTMYNAYQAGVISDISEVFEKYASAEVKAIMENNKELFSGCYIDGKMVAIPALGSAIEGTSTLLWIREDWMKNLNLKNPGTLEDVIEIARAFTYDDPDGNGKDDTYGLGLQKDIFHSEYGNILGIAGAYGVPILSSANGGMWYKSADGTVTNGSIQPGMKEALRTLQKMYGDGLISPEFGVMDASSLEEEITGSKVGMIFGYSGVGFYPCNSLYNTDHNAKFMPYAVPAAEGYDVVLGCSWPVQGYYMVRSDYEHPELLVKLLNINKSINNVNITAETSAAYTDNGLWMLAPVQTSAPTYFEQAQEIIDAVNNDDGGANISSNECKGRYDLVLDFLKSGNNDNYQYGWWAQYGPGSAAEVIMDDYIPNNKLCVTLLTGRQPDSMVQQLPSLLDMRDQIFTEIVKGADIDKFDAFVENWKKAGGQQILNDLEEIYK